MNQLVLPLDAFVRSMGVNRGTPHTFFLGAGASISSGMPSAEMCIWEWKRSIFLTNNPGLESQFGELSLPSVRDKIQRWLDAQRCYPTRGSSDEYGFYIERCYPIAEDRRRFFQRKVESARPQTGYKLVCALAEGGIVDSVWTTNFDGLAARAAADFNLTPLEIGIDCQQRILRPPRGGELLCVSLHGDYRYDALKNTPAELRDQESKLRDALVRHAADRPLVVVGYSGRDASIMAALADACRELGRGALFWCGHADPPMTGPIADLIAAAHRSRRTAHYVPTLGFDDLLIRLAAHCLDGEALERATNISSAAGPRLKDRPCAEFAVPDMPDAGVIKSNAFRVDCPPEVLAFDLADWPEMRVWAWMEEQIAGFDLVAVPFRGKVLAVGTIADIQAAFGDRLKGPIERTPIGEEDLRFEDGPVVSLLRRALIQSVAASRGLGTDRRGLVWELKSDDTRTVGMREYRIHQSAIIFLRRLGNETYAIIKPSIRAVDADGQEPPEDVGRQLKVSILGWQHNKPFNQAMTRWRERLFPANASTFEFPPNSGSSFRFKFRRAPAFSRLASRSGERTISLKSSFLANVPHRGFCLDEPLLVFASRRSNSPVRDPHPIRGILQNRRSTMHLRALA